MTVHSHPAAGASWPDETPTNLHPWPSEGAAPPTPLVDPTFSIATGSVWPNADARFLFPPSNLYSGLGIDEIGVVCDGATSLVILVRFAMPAADTNLVNDMTVLARRLDGFDFQVEVTVNADRSFTGAVSQTGGTWMRATSAAGALELGGEYTLALVFNGGLVGAANQLRVYVTDGMGELTQASPTYSGDASVTALFGPAFSGWTIGGVYTSETTISRGLRDLTVYSVHFWTGLVPTGYNLARACYAEDPVDYLGAVTELITCDGASASTAVYGGTALVLGTPTAAPAATFEGFRRYPAAFASTLAEPGRRVIQDPQGDGSESPYVIAPGTTTYSVSGITVYDEAVSIEVPDPNGFVLVSGTAAGDPAAIFGDQVFTPADGFVLHSDAEVDDNSFGTRGLYGVIPGFGPGFQPSGAEGYGYGCDSTDAVIDGWHRATDVTFSALGAAAPRTNGRRWGYLVVHEAGSSDIYLALIDKTDRFNPVLVDEGVYPFIYPLTLLWLEINASPGFITGPVRRHLIRVIEGRLQLAAA